MKLPLSWLREYVPVEAEPRSLAEALTAAGLAVDAVETMGDETVLELDITTNRVDCMNVYGVAREVAALYGLALRPLETAVAAVGEPAAAALDVAIEAPDLCGRFCARILDVKVGPSPAWLRDRLELVGIRSINNVVDLTNYVMVEMGQPSHAFDLARVPGGKLVVRWSREGERVTTLDGIERVLPARVGVIAGEGGEPGLALAGIMGGASSEISGATRAVVLEAAWWEPLAVRRGARALGMHTEASHRFERGADIAAGPASIDRLAHLLSKIGGGDGATRSRRAQGARPTGADGPPPAVAGERSPRRRGSAAAAGAHPRVARLPGDRLRSGGNRPRPLLAPRRLEGGRSRGGGRPALRPPADRSRSAAGDPPGPPPAVAAARAAHP